jgi:oligopeptide transport system permease protein
MMRFLAMRFLQAIPVLLAVVTLAFFLARAAPGGPFDVERAAPQEVLRALNERYHLDEPWPRQYLHYLGAALRGDLGPSFRYPGRSVNEILAAGFPVTLELGCLALLVALPLGLGAGIIAALRPRSVIDRGAMAAAMAGICLPTYVMGPLLVLVFGIGLEWLPVSGWGFQPGDKILPSLTLGLPYAAYIARLARAGLLDVLAQDFIRAARARGLSEGRVIVVHALRGGLAPVIAFLGPALAGLLSGSFVVETLFQIPGLGRYYIQAAFNRDYTLILGTTIFLAVLVIVFNLLADLLAYVLDPRLRRAGTR